MALLTSKTADTSPTSDDLLYTVNDPGGTPADRKVTAANLITKAHGLSDSTAVGVSGGVMTSGTDVAVADGGTGASNASGARTNLGLVIGTDVLAPSGSAASLTSFPTLNQDTTGKSAKTDALNSATTVVNVSSATAPSNGQVLTATSGTAATWQTPSGGGDASTNTASSVDGEAVLFSGTGGKTLKRSALTGIIKETSGVASVATAGTDYYNPGGTDVAVADGGTGASTAVTARSNLGLSTILGFVPMYTGQYFSPSRHTSVTTFNMSDERHYWLPCYLSEDVAIDRIGVTVTAAGSAGTVIRLGRYTANASGRPNTLAVDYGTVAGDGIASVEATVSDTLPRGFFFLCAVADITGGTLTVRGVSTTTMQLPGSGISSSQVAQSNTAYIATGAGSAALLSPAGAPTSLSTSGVAIGVRVT